eukprot:COSAG01_NODE_1687_length_9495_cov_2.856003_11_plen_46_part_00
MHLDRRLMARVWLGAWVGITGGWAFARYGTQRWDHFLKPPPSSSA